jgi:hypothetical protein
MFTFRKLRSFNFFESLCVQPNVCESVNCSDIFSGEENGEAAASHPKQNRSP